MFSFSYQNGYERELELEEGKIYKMITRAIKPKLFGKESKTWHLLEFEISV